ncbi:AsmA-like C-terminal region-containing protein [Puia dinghuensis]|uniref:AsmA-like C-terminal domain-containing protein n=1 Tax=Puia dinghuensis TaxID=1792502 RepID=A0A8J2UG54_9BACT|nr:AsmA-like C-terminal region-containing protein [Puia dinghuensis]GGB11084.1 hypothetical protein GCM10011511_38340 [Puia dinghuensis]
MKRALRYLIRIAGALVCLLLLAWLCLVGYVELNKAALLEKARSAFQDRLGGALRIGKLDISFFRHFPNVTARLSTVTLRDSAWTQHHHDLLQAADVYITCNLFKSLFARRLQVGAVDLEHGQVYLYTDSTGYSNTDMLRTLQPANTRSRPDLPDIGLTDIRWVMEKQNKHKFFDLDIQHLHCGITRDRRLLRFDVNANIRADDFSFNTANGSFIKGRALLGRFTVDYNTASKIIQFNEAKLEIDDHLFVFSGRFFPTVSPDPFFLKIETAHILYRHASALLTPHLRQELDKYDIDKPVSVYAQLDAGAADDPEPQIQVRLDLDKGSVLTPDGRFTGVSFKGSFTNEWQRGQKRRDENSGIRLLGFSGQLQKLPFQADTIAITNLKHPQLACDLRSHFGLEALNDLTGSQTLQFTGGAGTMNLVYKGPLSENDTAGTTVNGWLDLDSAALTYLPYSFRLTNGKGRLRFRDQDLLVDQLSIHAGGSMINVKGIARNLVALLDRNEENVSMDWNLASPRLDLGDLAVLAGRPTATNFRQSGTSAFGTTFGRVDRLLKEGIIHVGVEANDLRFRKFSGANAKADLLFEDHQIILTRLTMDQGAFDLKGTIDRRRPGDVLVSLESHLKDVDLPRLFNAFGDFGQDAITARNLKGSLTADIRLNGAMTDKKKMDPNSLKGSVDFTINNGQLVDFEPMEKIKVFVLKDRDLSTIRFAELKNRLDLDSTTLTIHRMEIRSTAFTLFAEGTYDLKTGPDISLRVPFSNFSKNQTIDISPDSRGNYSKAGISVWLRARRGVDGKLKITWDPFKKALKQAKANNTRGAN